MSVLKALVGISARVVESGLMTMGATLESAQSVIARLAGSSANPAPIHAELDGPHDLDRATSELANRLARLARYWTASSNGGIRGAAADAWSAARRSFKGIDLKDPRRWVALPLQLPLSFAELFAQEGVRSLHTLEVVGPRKTPKFVVEVSEAFLDIPVYVCLQYREEIDRFKRRLRGHPDDRRTRLELARSYIKCGLYEEALAELEEAAKSPSLRDRARYESIIAHYRGGNYGRAAREGATAMADGLRNGRIQYWTWLAARKIGAYPPETPPECRVEMEAGRHPTSLRYEDVAARTGLDKTSGGRGIAVFDYDGDGLQDVLISAVSGGIGVYHNNGDGTFRDVTVGSGLDA